MSSGKRLIAPKIFESDVPLLKRQLRASVQQTQKSFSTSEPAKSRRLAVSPTSSARTAALWQAKWFNGCFQRPSGRPRGSDGRRTGSRPRAAPSQLATTGGACNRACRSMPVRPSYRSDWRAKAGLPRPAVKACVRACLNSIPGGHLRGKAREIRRPGANWPLDDRKGPSPPGGYIDGAA